MQPDPVPQGRLKVVQDWIAAYFQPSLRDWIVLSSNPGLASWAKFSRPFGAELEMEFSHTPEGWLKAVLFTRFLQDKILSTTTYTTLCRDAPH
jgi:hypothetical protein